jgi:hypothetical protein
MDEHWRMGPLTPDHPLLDKDTCAACHQPFKAGQYVTLIALGPGDDEEERTKARKGNPYNAVAVPVHWACATGIKE